MKYLDDQVYRQDVKRTIENVSRLSDLYHKRILVLGASGLIGSFLVDCLLYANEQLDAGIDIWASGRKKEKLFCRFGEESEALHFVEADVTSLCLDERIDYFIHAGGYGHPRAFRENPVEVMCSNFVGTRQVLELARKSKGSRVLFISSGEVYGNVDHMTVRACYPISKIAAETLCLSYIQQYGVNVVVARPCHTFGPAVTDEDNRAASHFIRNAALGKDIVMNSAGIQRRSFAYVSDCVSGILTILTDGKIGMAYDVTSDETLTIRQYAELCASVAGVKVYINEKDDIGKKEQSPIASQILDNHELKELGWRPIYHIIEGIENSVAIQRSIRGIK